MPFTTLQFADPPPPIGGVTVSVKNLSESLKRKGVPCFLKHQDSVFKTYDIGHVHASHRIKRLAQIMWLKIKCKKVMFTVHGLYFDDDFINRCCIQLSSGVIFLNEKLKSQWQDKMRTPCVVLPSMFKEGFSQNLTEKTTSKSGKKTILLYAHSRSFKNGEEVYGIEFSLNALEEAKCDLEVVLVDPNAEYRSLVEIKKQTLQIEYHPQPVDFQSLLLRCDIYLRPTCMDGSSVAVLEALALGTTVIASDVVDRPEGVVLYKHRNKRDLLEKLYRDYASGEKQALASVDSYIDFVSSLLSGKSK